MIMRILNLLLFLISLVIILLLSVEVFFKNVEFKIELRNEIETVQEKQRIVRYQCDWKHCLGKCWGVG